MSAPVSKAVSQLIQDARKPVVEVVEMCLEGMITKDEAFDKIALLVLPPGVIAGLDLGKRG